jgi:hypothetical protein
MCRCSDYDLVCKIFGDQLTPPLLKYFGWCRTAREALFHMMHLWDLEFTRT